MKSPPGTLARRVETTAGRAAPAVLPPGLWNWRAAVSFKGVMSSRKVRPNPIDNVRSVPMGSMSGSWGAGLG